MLSKLLFLLSAYSFVNTIQAQPNLIGSFTSAPNSNIKRGDYLTFSFKIKNTGNLIAQKSHVSVYLSPTQSLTGATLLSEISTELLLNNSETQNINYVYPVPYNLSNGSYYVIIYPDSRREVVGNASNLIYSLTNTITINSDGGKQNLPYPVILIHGLNGNDTTWNDFLSDIKNFYGWSFGGKMNFCLNQDGNLVTSNLTTDLADWTNQSLLTKGDFYTINFDIDNNGAIYANTASIQSNQAAIVKQGVAIKRAIQYVLEKTGRDKVILAGHSMGGLAAREYLQNSTIWQSDNKHHVAKLFTLGTPHGGSNATGLGIAAAFGSLRETSDAVRDLRTSYEWSDADGVYLSGGVESYDVMVSSGALPPYNNVDVNCNTIVGNTIIGLNNKTIPIDLSYSCVIGNDTYLIPLCSNCDGVVSFTSANLNNYKPQTNADTFYCSGSGDAVIFGGDPWHVKLTKQTYFIMKGLDEPYDYGLGYDVNFDKTYFGNFTTQSLGAPYTADFDEYKFSVPVNQIINLKVYNIQTGVCRIAVFDYSSLNPIYTTYTDGKGYLDINFPINAGNYFLEVGSVVEDYSWYFPYAIKLTLTGSGACYGGYVAFNSNTPGSSYQWQVDKGSGYINITDDSIYVGTNATLLQLKSPSTNWYGYKYRCVVNGISISTENILKFTGIWTGASNTAWENPSNWNCGIVPDINTDVIINSGVSNFPQVNLNQYCRSLSVAPAANILVKASVNLIITGK